MRNSIGKIYVGRSSGYGDPYSILMNRFKRHHMAPFGYGNPILDKVAIGYPVGYGIIRGREQDLIDGYGGIGSPLLGNSVNGIWRYNPTTFIYVSNVRDIWPKDFKEILIRTLNKNRDL